MTGYELGIALAVASLATFHDLRHRTLPDWLAVGTGIAGLALHAWQGHEALAASVLGAVVCAILPSIFVARGGIGWGDVKLFSALGALLGPLVGLEVQLYAFAAAFLAAPIVAWQKGTLRALLRLRRPETERGSTWMPLAPATLVSVLVAFGVQ